MHQALRFGSRFPARGQEAFTQPCDLSPEETFHARAMRAVKPTEQPSLICDALPAASRRRSHRVRGVSTTSGVKTDRMEQRDTAHVKQAEGWTE